MHLLCQEGAQLVVVKLAGLVLVVLGEYLSNVGLHVWEVGSGRGLALLEQPLGKQGTALRFMPKVGV